MSESALNVGPVVAAADPIGPIVAAALPVGPVLVDSLTIPPAVVVPVRYLVTQAGGPITTQAGERIEVAA